MATELVIVLLLIVANGLFAGAEIAILSVRKLRVQEAVDRGDRKAMAVQTLRQHPERFLATVQVGITVLSSAAAAFGGASIAMSLTPMLEGIGLDEHAHDVALAFVVISISFLSLVLGELVPKSLALRYSHGYSFLVSRPLLGLSRIARPLVWFLTACSNLVLRLFGDSTTFVESRVSRDEIQHLVQEAATSGSLDPGTSQITSRALEFADVMVSEVMVRRDEIAAIRRGASAEEVQRLLLEEGHSRIPVYDREIEHLSGYVVARDVLAVLWEGAPTAIDELVRPLFLVPMTSRINVVLREMQARRQQIAGVIDEHGSTVGIVTIEDLIEELIGDIFDEHDAPDEIVQREAAGTALVAGWVPVRKVNRALGTELPIGGDSTTIAGLCIALALAIPAVGTRWRAGDGTVLEIVEASPRRVRLVRIHQQAGEQGKPEPSAPS